MFLQSLTSDSLGISLLLLALLLASALIASSLRNTGRLHYPPAPPGLPLLGNVFDMPKSMSAIEFDELTKRYGKALYWITQRGRHVILLGTLETASDILEKRSLNYSDKPTSIMAELIGINWNTALLGYGETWRTHRRELHRFLGSSAVAHSHKFLEQQTQRLLKDIAQDPGRFSEHVRFIVGATITKIAYGLDVKDTDDEYLKLSEEGNDIFREAFVPGRYLAESFPILKHIPPWFPGARFRTQTAAWRKRYVEIHNKPFKATMDNVRRGHDHSSVAAMVMRHAEENGDDLEEAEELAKSIASISYLAGADTTYTIIRVFFLAMTKYPDAQRAAQKELDAVVGPGRLPRFSDRDSLPYVQALVKECIRWQPIVPLALPTTSVSDDEYRGYLIPAKSLVIPNSWAFSRDTRLYPDPETFAPGRYLKDGQVNPEVLDPNVFAFGLGRRVCPGREFALSSLFISIASLLHAFTIGPPLDKDGNPVMPDVKMSTGILAVPDPFSCTITVRKPAIQALYRRTTYLGEKPVIFAWRKLRHFAIVHSPLPNIIGTIYNY